MRNEQAIQEKNRKITGEIQNEHMSIQGECGRNTRTTTAQETTQGIHEEYANEMLEEDY